MARRMMPPGGSRMDFPVGPPPMMDFGCGPRMPYNNPRMDYCGPRGMDYGYEDNGPHRMKYRGAGGYMDDGDDLRRPHMRVHCGELREHHAGMVVEISGRVHKQRLGRFLTLKDANGMTQLVVPDNKTYLVRRITNIPFDSYIVVNGTVNKRPKDKRNTVMSTGNVEVIINKILNVTINRQRHSKEVMGLVAMQMRNNSTTSHSLSLTSEEFKRCGPQSVSTQFSKRTHNCGEMCAEFEGEEVTLCGWIESNKGKFIHLRDGYGLVQVVIPPTNVELVDKAKNVKVDTIVEIRGKVNLRPETQRNPTLQTGDVEIQALKINEIVPVDSEVVESTDAMTVEALDVDNVNVNSFTTRTHNCGELRETDIGKSVTLCGWLEFHRMGKFVILRDGYGKTQLIIPDEKTDMQQILDKTPYESILEAKGVVTGRPPGSEQKALDTGKVEVVVQEINILNRAKTQLPFNVREYNKAKEPLRMEHRYLNLRFPDMQRNLRIRSRLLMDMRDYLVNKADFVDVETPTLFRATPGGAQEFIVPTRTAGRCYSLVQSPQQFKQMLMSGGIDRYFQIARCYRDEGARPDRQPEFTQLDIEISFTSVDGVLDLIEKLLKYSWPISLSPITIPFPRIKYEDAMRDYGSDKPDLRITSKLVDCTDVLKTNPDLVKCEDFCASAIVFKKPLNALTVSLKTIYENMAKGYPDTKLVQARLADNVEYWTKEVSKLLGEDVPKTLVEHLQLEGDKVLFLAYGDRKQVLPLLGKIRVEYVNHMEQKGHFVRRPEVMHFLWVVDYPLFEQGEQPGTLLSAHHPFTAPHPDDIGLLKTEPLKVRGQSYDLVLNGMEVGGGSIRIHDEKQQREVLQQLNITSDTMEHLLSALGSGCPPHGGIALGLDRLIATILNTNSIRDVIAFPKGVEGKDPLSGAPIKVTEADKKLYHLEIVEESVENEKNVEKEEIPVLSNVEMA